MRTEADDPLERRRDTLRRIVYGTPDPSEAVIGELVAVEAELVAREAIVDRERAAHASIGLPRAGDPESGSGDDAVRTGRIRMPRWVLVGSLAVALMAAMPVLGSLRDAMSPPRGLEVFERLPPAYERGLARKVVETAGLQSTSPEALRSLGRVLGHEFWAYREEGRVCLLSRREFWFAWVEECVAVDHFATSGLGRVIQAGELTDRVRSTLDISYGEAVIVNWRASSIELEWSIVPGSGYGSDREPAGGPSFGVGDVPPMTYGEWSSSRIADDGGGS
ncbi:hypothetical protein [Agromyces neolithicus]|uniref:DUF1707 domain-containing protein n=1 Tax=Agromyces neolithicus TaxID=269420 RepID=A0ABN2M2Z9_9MICO